MPRTVAGLILAALLVAGCVQESPPPLTTDGPTATVAPAPAPAYTDGSCANGLLFQIVEFAQTDPYLPPGFHPRDPQGFLNTPLAFGQAAALLMVLDCASPTSGPLTVAFLGIFIEAPTVDGVEPAPFNFYELARYGDVAEFGGALVDGHWPLAGAEVTVVSDGSTQAPVDAVATVSDDAGLIVDFGGVVSTPVPVGDGPTRFWHQDADALAYIEYTARLDSHVGSGICRVRAGTPMAAFVGQPLAGDVACPGQGSGEPIVAVLTDLRLNATFQRLAGVQAG